MVDVRALKTFDNVPRELFEDSADEILDGESIDRIYRYGDALIQAPSNAILGLFDEDKVVGIIWLTYDVISNTLNCRYVAALPEYRNYSIVMLTTEKMKDLGSKLGVGRILGCTTKMSEHWHDLGWKLLKSRFIYQDIKEDSHG